MLLTGRNKGSVESLVKWVKGNLLPGRSFADDADLSFQAGVWQEGANTRPSSATGVPPLHRLPKEAATGGVLPATAHDYGVLLTGQVSVEALVAVLGNRYSVPVSHVGAPLTVRVHRDRVRLWRDSACVADHRRAPDGGRQRVIDPAHFAPLFSRKPRAQVMLYRDVLCGLGGHAPAFLAALSRRHRARLREEVLAVYALYECYGAANLRAAMALADEAGTYSADALALLLDAPHSVPPPLPSLPLRGVPTQAEVDRLLSVYETWVHVDVATPEAGAEVAV